MQKVQKIKLKKTSCKKKKRGPVKIPDKKHYVYLTYIEDRTYGERDGDGPFASRSREPGDISFQPLGLSVETPDWSEQIEIDSDPDSLIGQEFYVVIVRYRDGDTFGYTTGHWHVAEIERNKDKARDIASQIRSNTYKGWRPWDGYFAKLENIEIHCFRLGEKAQYTDIIYHG